MALSGIIRIQEVAPSEMFQTGDAIGPYTLLRILGRGASGEVWLAERVSTLITIRVALKLPLDETSDLDLIRQEAQVWLRASGHPNIVPVLDAEVYDGQVAIASEYIAGGSLHDWMTEKSPSNGNAPSIEEAVAIRIGKSAQDQRANREHFGYARLYGSRNVFWRLFHRVRSLVGGRAPLRTSLPRASVPRPGLDGAQPGHSEPGACPASRRHS